MSQPLNLNLISCCQVAQIAAAAKEGEQGDKSPQAGVQQDAMSGAGDVEHPDQHESEKIKTNVHEQGEQPLVHPKGTVDNTSDDHDQGVSDPPSDVATVSAENSKQQ